MEETTESGQKCHKLPGRRIGFEAEEGLVFLPGGGGWMERDN